MYSRIKMRILEYYDFFLIYELKYFPPKNEFFREQLFGYLKVWFIQEKHGKCSVLFHDLTIFRIGSLASPKVTGEFGWGQREASFCSVFVRIIMSLRIFNTSDMFQSTAIITLIDAKLTHHPPLQVGESF